MMLKSPVKLALLLSRGLEQLLGCNAGGEAKLLEVSKFPLHLLLGRSSDLVVEDPSPRLHLARGGPGRPLLPAAPSQNPEATDSLLHLFRVVGL